MILRVAVAAGRHRRAVLAGGVTLVAIALVAGWLGVPRAALATGLGVLTGLLAVLCLAFFLAPSGRRPGASLVVSADGRSFRTPATIVHTLAAVAHLSLIGTFLLYPDEIFWAGDWTERLAVVAFAALFFAYPAAMWRGVGVVLSADGIRAEKFAGVVTIPWEAIVVKPVVAEVGGAVTLTYARRELVRVGSGWVVNRRELLAEATDGRFLAAVVDFYRTHPQERAGIGTEAGLERLRAGVVAAEPHREPADRHTSIVMIVVAVLVAVGAVAADVWIGDESVLGRLVHLGSGALAVGAGSVVVVAVKGLRGSR